MMAFLLLAPASTKWLGWRKDRTSPRDRLGRFCDIYCAVILRHSFYVTCYRWHSVEQLFQWKLWTKILTTLVKRRKSYKCVCINSWGVFLTRVHKSFTGNLARHSFSLFEQNTTQPQTSKTSEQRPSFSLAKRWTITEIRPQSNSVLTYSLLTDVLSL